MVSTVKIITRNYPCRPQVIERQQKWVKFGIPKDIPRGTNDRGVLIVGERVNFATDEDDGVNQEIEVAQKLIEMGKKQLMSKQLKI